MSFTKQTHTNHNTIEIPMGGLGLTTPEKTSLQTFVGSCIAICLYDPSVKIAAMAHIMLPKNNTNDPNPKPEAKFADVAIKIMLDKMQANGAKLNRLKAKMAGGANIFQNEGKPNVFNIGSRNADAIKSLLDEKKIPIVAQDIGATSGRWITFDMNSLEMKIKDRAKGVTII
ncbi:chemotaxis protein CheD [Candidatus Nitrosotenuis chungbukensis]|uniref:chemotaxis protein CheD n=2 Tax=Candidatus Nitrosotenuis chungbukensis TaxID=1353246 RepID=UPI0009DCE232|nr:chemotaxis protein CheD [Candidatus Nitrosotenuis chungbukensis]